jgi:ATP-dependent DNA helicase PIF1
MNKNVAIINKILPECIPGRKTNYYSQDVICDPQFRMHVPVELLNPIELISLPPHELVLRIGAPIILLRNLDPVAGLCNGTRLIVRFLHNSIIEATIVTGPNAGNIIYIPRIKLITMTNGKNPYDFSRAQFPVRLAFSRPLTKLRDKHWILLGYTFPLMFLAMVNYMLLYQGLVNPHL